MSTRVSSDVTIPSVNISNPPQSTSSSSITSALEAISSSIRPNVTSIRTTVVTFIGTIALGASKLVQYVAFVASLYLFKPNYSKAISKTISKETEDEMLSQMKTGGNKKQHEIFVKAIRIAAKNEGDVPTATRIVKKYAEVKKGSFMKVAKAVIRDVTEKKISRDDFERAGDFVLKQLELGSVTFIDLDHAVNIVLYMHGKELEEQMSMLRYQIIHAQNKSEISHVRQLFRIFADDYPKAFEKFALYLLKEIGQDIKNKDKNTAAQLAKKWIKSENLSLVHARKALDLISVDELAGVLKKTPRFNRPLKIHHHFSNNNFSEREDTFMAKALLSKLGEINPKLMRNLSFQMIKVDRGLEESKQAGLFKNALQDTEWEKATFDPAKHTQDWAKTERFDINVMLEATKRLWYATLKRVFRDENKMFSKKIDTFGKALDLAELCELPELINTFAKEAPLKVVSSFVNHMIAKARDEVANITGLKKGAKISNPQAAVIAMGEAIGKLHPDQNEDQIQALFEDLEGAVLAAQKELLRDEVMRSEQLEEKLNALLLIMKRTGETGETGKIFKPVFAYDMCDRFAVSNPEDFGKLALHMAEKHSKMPFVKQFCEKAKSDPRRPEAVHREKQEKYDAYTRWQKLWYEKPVLSENEKAKLNALVYGKALQNQIKKLKQEEKDYYGDNFLWLIEGISSYIQKQGHVA